MPLRCLDDARATVHAFGHDDAAWADLIAANRARRHLRTRCCDAPLALKTSRLGTRFFAHLARGACATGDETPEHLHLKWLAVQAARARGWSAETEVSGTTPTGEPWRADVLATKGRHTVAIEVQWSAQDDAETLQRQARYKAAGVRGLWLFRQPGFPDSGDLPAVRVRGSLARGFTALDLPIDAMLDAAFDRRLRFGIPTGATAAMTVSSIAMACWNRDCGALNRPIFMVTLRYAATICEFSLRDLTAYPGLAARIVAALPPDPARGRIAPRTSAKARATYLSNGCFRCDKLLGDGFLMSDPRSLARSAAVPVSIDAQWRAAIDGNPGFAPAWSVVAPAAPSD